MAIRYDYIDIKDTDRSEQLTLVEYKYYSVLRPISLGTYPNRRGNHFKSFMNYSDRTEVKPGVRAWGEIIYPLPLTDKEMDDYELVMA